MSIALRELSSGRRFTIYAMEEVAATAGPSRARQGTMKDNSQVLAKLLAEAREHIAYKTEGAIIEFTEELSRVMKQTGCSKAELAKRLGCKPAFITKLLSGQNNFTIETMVKVAAAVGTEVRMHLRPVKKNVVKPRPWSRPADIAA